MEAFLTMGIVQGVLDILHTYAMDTIVVLTGSTIMGFVLYTRERSEWKRGRFEDRINLSLNTLWFNHLDEGRLRIRTIGEYPLKDVIRSRYARRLIKRAAKKTTKKNPFLRFRSTSDAWMVHNEVLNTISGIYAAKFLEAELYEGAGKREGEFYFMITWERDADVEIQKFRVLLIQPEVLRYLVMQSNTERSVEPERHEHKSRVTTLVKMSRYFEGVVPSLNVVRLPLR